MIPRPLHALARVAAVVAACAGGFFAIEEPLRHFETRAATATLNALGAERAHMVLPTSIQVFPSNGDAFRAVITPACSSGGSLLAVAALASLTPAHLAGRRRRLMATTVAITAIAAGNIGRIVASIGVGFVAGRPSLVLFHDWVGSMFTFAYTLGGFVILLYLLLPSHSRRVHDEVALAA